MYRYRAVRSRSCWRRESVPEYARSPRRPGTSREHSGRRADEAARQREGQAERDRPLLVVEVNVPVPGLKVNRATLVIKGRVINRNAWHLDNTGFNSVDQGEVRDCPRKRLGLQLGRPPKPHGCRREIEDLSESISSAECRATHRTTARHASFRPSHPDQRHRQQGQRPAACSSDALRR